MSKSIRVLLTAAVVALGLGLGSCTDNIDNSTKPGDPPQEEQVSDEQMAKAQKFWSVVSQLVDVDDYTPDYEDKVFEPVYGETVGTDATTRYVFTNTGAAAAARFADLVERDDIDETTQTYTFEDSDIGTLIYKKGTGRELATVEVSIKQIPSLKKIVYMSGAYANGYFEGRAYYRFGDVVSRQAEGYDGEPVTEYWICVRPSFGPENKGDSHWVCLNVLPKKNVWHHHSSFNNYDYYLPTGLGTNKEQMQNLAEMLYAIYNPEKWWNNVANDNNTDLPMFHDFDKGKRDFHNRNFWQSVQNAWRHFNIPALAMNIGSEAAQGQFAESKENHYPQVRLLYNGYSWLKTFSWNCTLYEAQYSCGFLIGLPNMYTADYSSSTKDMQYISMDCRMMGQTGFDDYKAFFNYDGIYRWAIRHATGKELSANGRYDKKGPINGVTDVYRYYHDVVENADLGANPEVTAEVKTFDGDDPDEDDPEEDIITEDKLKVGHVIGQSGQFYKSCYAARRHDNQPVAVVAYLGGDMRVEKNTEWNGLAIALEDSNIDIAYGVEGQDDHSCVTAIHGFENMGSTFDGWAMTQRLMNNECNAIHRHPAAEAMGDLDTVEGCSEWFIGGLAQWDLVMQGMGYGKWMWSIYDGWSYKNKGRWPWQEIDAPFGFLIETVGYVTSTVSDTQDDSFVYHFIFNSQSFIKINYDVFSPTAIGCIRPFLAFKYGDGGSKDPE